MPENFNFNTSISHYCCAQTLAYGLAQAIAYFVRDLCQAVVCEGFMGNTLKRGDRMTSYQLNRYVLGCPLAHGLLFQTYEAMLSIFYRLPKYYFITCLHTEGVSKEPCHERLYIRGHQPF